MISPTLNENILWAESSEISPSSVNSSNDNSNNNNNNNNNNLLIYSALFNIPGDQKRITTINVFDLHVMKIRQIKSLKSPYTTRINPSCLSS